MNNVLIGYSIFLISLIWFSGLLIYRIATANEVDPNNLAPTIERVKLPYTDESNNDPQESERSSMEEDHSELTVGSR